MKKIALLLILSTLYLTSCNKEGPGGKAHIHGYAKYNNTALANTIAYIWYGKTAVSDVTTGYDDEVVVDNTGYFEFHELHKGDYYIYAKNFDGTITRSAEQAVKIEGKKDQVEVNLNLQ